MWEFIDVLKSMYEPRFLTTDDFVIAEVPTEIEEIFNLDNCCRVPIMRNSDFSSLRSSLSSSIRERMSSMQFCMAVTGSCWLDKSSGLKDKYFLWIIRITVRIWKVTFNDVKILSKLPKRWAREGKKQGLAKVSQRFLSETVGLVGGLQQHCLQSAECTPSMMFGHPHSFVWFSQRSVPCFSLKLKNKIQHYNVNFKSIFWHKCLSFIKEVVDSQAYRSLIIHFELRY